MFAGLYVRIRGHQVHIYLIYNPIFLTVISDFSYILIFTIFFTIYSYILQLKLCTSNSLLKKSGYELYATVREVHTTRNSVNRAFCCILCVQHTQLPVYHEVGEVD
jgi:hypothetical protein